MTGHTIIKRLAEEYHNYNLTRFPMRVFTSEELIKSIAEALDKYNDNLDYWMPWVNIPKPWEKP